MKLWKYIHLESDYKTVLRPHAFKTPIVWADNQPDSDYAELTGLELQAYLVDLEKSNYPARKASGSDYSDYMNARLVVLRKGLPEPLKDVVCGYIYDMTNATRIEITEGLWISAKREADKMVPNASLQDLIDQHTLPINQENLIQEIKDKISTSIIELYQ